MKKHLNIILLLTIVLLGLFLRFYQLGNIGIGFFRDEAALGLNTWSILKTGADEYGQHLPLVFRSFEVFFMPAYIYLSLPIFFLFGLTEFSTRALAALSGTLLIVVSYLISKEIFKSKKVGLLTALVIAVSPWSIFYSRGAFEGNLALLFFSLGFYWWLKFLDGQKKKFFFISIFTFILSMSSYQAPRFVAPVFIGLSILFSKGWLKKWKLWLAGGVFALALYLPLFVLTTSAAGYHRAIGVSIFSSQVPVPGYNENFGQWQNLYLVPREVTSLYLHYFSPSNLFGQGDYNLQRRVPNFSVFYLWQLPLLIIGLIKIFKINSEKIKNLLIWLLIAPIPAALTRDPFHTYRAILFWLPISILIALGFSQFLEFFKKQKILILTASFLIILFSVSSYFYSLFKIMPIVYGKEWDYGYKEVVDFIKTQPSDLRVVIDDPGTQPYIHFLFYQALSIKEYQEVAANTLGNQYYTNPDFLRPKKVGRFEFRKVDWPTERGDKKTIFIFPADRLQPSEFSGDPKLALVKTIFSPLGEPAFYIVKNISQ